MKIQVPTQLKDITLSQWMKYQAYLNANENLTDKQKTDKAISVFCNIKMKEVNDIPYKDYKEIAQLIDHALNEDAPDLIFHYKELSFIPNLDSLTAGEYADLESYYKTDDSELDKVMNILYRPRTTKVFDHYAIEPYDSDKEVNPLIYEMPMSVVKSAIGFFLSLRNDLYRCTLSYLKEEEKARQRM